MTAAADVVAVLAALVEQVRGGRSAFLMDQDGILIGQASAERSGDLEAVAGECSGLMREVRAVASASGWGEPRTLTLRGNGGYLVFGFGRGDLVCGLEAGQEGIGGQLRQAVLQALDKLGSL